MESEKIARCVCGGRAHVTKEELGYTVRCENDPCLAKAPAYKSEARAIRQWNTAQEEMDSGTVCVIKAYHCGMSYGQYMATRPLEPAAVRFPKKEQTPPAATVPELRCINCGMLIPPAVRSKKYCCYECADKYRQQQRNMRDRIARQKQAAEKPKPVLFCKMCKREIPPESNRKCYCSEACARSAARMQSVGRIRKKAQRK